MPFLQRSVGFYFPGDKNQSKYNARVVNYQLDFNPSITDMYQRILRWVSNIPEDIIDRFQKDNDEFMNPSNFILTSTVKIIEDSIQPIQQIAYETGVAIHQAVFETSYILNEFAHLPDYPENQPLEMDYYDLGEKRKSLTEERIDNLFTFHLRSALGFNELHANHERITKMIASVKSLVNDPAVTEHLNSEMAEALIKKLDALYDTELKPSMETLRKEYAFFMKLTSMLIAFGKEKGYRVPEDWMEF